VSSTALPSLAGSIAPTAAKAPLPAPAAGLSAIVKQLNDVGRMSVRRSLAGRELLNRSFYSVATQTPIGESRDDGHLENWPGVGSSIEKPKNPLPG
jgi:hypothetical protein